MIQSEEKNVEDKKKKLLNLYKIYNDPTNPGAKDELCKEITKELTQNPINYMNLFIDGWTYERTISLKTTSPHWPIISYIFGELVRLYPNQELIEEWSESEFQKGLEDFMLGTLENEVEIDKPFSSDYPKAFVKFIGFQIINDCRHYYHTLIMMKLAVVYRQPIMYRILYVLLTMLTEKKLPMYNAFYVQQLAHDLFFSFSELLMKSELDINVRICGFECLEEASNLISGYYHSPLDSRDILEAIKLAVFINNPKLNLIVFRILTEFCRDNYETICYNAQIMLDITLPLCQKTENYGEFLVWEAIALSEAYVKDREGIVLGAWNILLPCIMHRLTYDLEHSDPVKCVSAFARAEPSDIFTSINGEFLNQIHKQKPIEHVAALRLLGAIIHFVPIEISGVTLYNAIKFACDHVSSIDIGKELVFKFIKKCIQNHPILITSQVDFNYVLDKVIQYCIYDENVSKQTLKIAYHLLSLQYSNQCIDEFFSIVDRIEKSISIITPAVAFDFLDKFITIIPPQSVDRMIKILLPHINSKDQLHQFYLGTTSVVYSYCQISKQYSTDIEAQLLSMLSYDDDWSFHAVFPSIAKCMAKTKEMPVLIQDKLNMIQHCIRKALSLDENNAYTHSCMLVRELLKKKCLQPETQIELYNNLHGVFINTHYTDILAYLFTTIKDIVFGLYQDLLELEKEEENQKAEAARKAEEDAKNGKSLQKVPTTNKNEEAKTEKEKSPQTTEILIPVTIRDSIKDAFELTIKEAFEYPLHSFGSQELLASSLIASLSVLVDCMRQYNRIHLFTKIIRLLKRSHENGIFDREIIKAALKSVSYIIFQSKEKIKVVKEKPFLMDIIIAGTKSKNLKLAEKSQMLYAIIEYK